jgi:lysophospholipase L1-like esterase
MLTTLRPRTLLIIFTCVLSVAGIGRAQAPIANDATRYLAMGDSIAAGFKAQPATQGYAFLLYQDGVFDRPTHTLFNNIAAVGATSDDVLKYQVFEALIPGARGGFQPNDITLTVGGNDLAAIQRYAATNPTEAELQTFIGKALTDYMLNLRAILQQLVTDLPAAKIFVSNQYSSPEVEEIFPGGEQVIAGFNALTANEVAALPGHVYLVDVHSAFLDRTGLLLIERHGASPLEVHLTNAGHRAMAKAFAEVIEDAN